MIRKYLLPLFAIAGFLFALYTVAQGAKPIAIAAPVVEPALAPFDETIAGAGLVEAKSQNIAIGTPLAGIIAKVPVQIGQKVKRGELLFSIDDRDRRAELAVRQAALDSASAELARLVALPREEDLPPAQARLAAADAELADAKNQLALAESVQDKRAMSTQEWDRRRFAVMSAQARFEQARAELAKLKAGAWKPEIDIARVAVEAARAKLDAQKIELERLDVRAPSDGVAIAVDAREGEFAPTGALAKPLVVLGDLSRLHVRVDIDENDAWRLQAGASAVAYVRGNRDLKTTLEFVRVDPYVIPKRSLTGESTERVDTRVLQVIYSFDPAALPVYVGQQMDVFIHAAGASGTRVQKGTEAK